MKCNIQIIIFYREDCTDARIKISEKFKNIYFEFLEIYNEYKNQKYKLIDYQEIFLKLLSENQQFLNSYKLE